MFLVLSGEGVSDIGGDVSGAGGVRFDPGPLSLILDDMLEGRLGYRPVEMGFVHHVPRSSLSAAAKALTPKPSVMIPGVKRPKGNAGDYRQAFALASIALTLQAEADDSAIAVLFRDSDGTNSDDPRRWDNLVAAVNAAFEAAGFPTGVAMIAKPKQESWFMCALKDHPYEHCGGLEDESGNDNSPAALKEMVADKLGACDKQALVEWVVQRGFEHARVDMPSFNAFRDGLARALDHLVP